jgi:hypothetical protein
VFGGQLRAEPFQLVGDGLGLFGVQDPGEAVQDRAQLPGGYPHPGDRFG